MTNPKSSSSLKKLSRYVTKPSSAINSLPEQVYGFQGTKTGTSSECIVGRFAKDTKLDPNSAPLVIGTKFFTVPWTNFLVGGGFRLGKQSLLDALRASLKRLLISRVPLYQVLHCWWHEQDVTQILNSSRQDMPSCNSGSLATAALPP